MISIPGYDQTTKQAIATLRRVLIDLGWEPEPLETGTAFYVDFGPPHLPVSGALAAITQEAARFLFYLNFGVEVPLALRGEVEHFISLANWGLSIGNFEMDHRDGQLRFKSSVDFSNMGLTEQLIRNAILAAMTAAEFYADALMEVIEGRASADKAHGELLSLP